MAGWLVDDGLFENRSGLLLDLPRLVMSGMRPSLRGFGGEGNERGSEGEAVNTGSQQQQLVSGREDKTSGKPDTMGGLSFVQGKKAPRL